MKESSKNRRAIIFNALFFCACLALSFMNGRLWQFLLVFACFMLTYVIGYVLARKVLDWRYRRRIAR